VLKANETWHGFGNLAEGFNMLDPIKSTIITPGLNVSASSRTAAFRPPSSPSSWPSTAWSRRRGCTLLHHVHHRHHQGPLEHAADRAAAVQGRLRPQPAAVAGDAGVLQAFPRYERMGLRDLCQSVHEAYAQATSPA
jgi:ornithine decarboxylase/lysine decarboxylase/arginine decarboxylase